jgi:hypothetical protein
MTTTDSDMPSTAEPHGTARLCLEIGTAAGDRKTYTLRRDGDKWLLSRDGRVYEVSGAGCTCKDATCRKHQCKHQKALAALGLLADRGKEGKA